MRKQLRTVLDGARAILGTAELGVRDLEGGDPTRRLPGLHNVAVFGRSVTLTLQKARGVLGDPFDSDFYAAQATALAAWEESAKWVNLRNVILKEGPPSPSVGVEITYLDGTDIQALMKNPPAGAKGFFMGDQLGGSGWEVELPDGTVEKFYVALPPDIIDRVKTTFHLDGFTGDMATSAREYVRRLGDLLDEAEAYFEKLEDN